MGMDRIGLKQDIEENININPDQTFRFGEESLVCLSFHRADPSYKF